MLDLWPKDIGYAEVKAPVTILKEQASLLGEKTKNLVEAEVRRFDIPLNILGSGREFNYAFYIVAPTLSNYRYKLFTISHGIQFYPVIITPDSDMQLGVSPESPQEEIVAYSENEFLKILQEILNAGKTKQVIQALLAQISFEPNT